MQRFLIALVGSFVFLSLPISSGATTPRNRITDLNHIFAYVEAEMAHQHEIREALEQWNQHLQQLARKGQLRGGSDHFAFSSKDKARELEQAYQVALIQAEGGRFGSALRRLYGMSRSLEELLEELKTIDHQAAPASAVKVMEELERRFDDMVELEHQLGLEGDKWLLEKLAKESPWYEAQAALMKLSVQARGLSKALRSGEMETTDLHLQAFKAEHQKHALAQNRYLRPLVAQPGSQRDPSHRFQACLQQSAALISFVEEYLTGVGSHPPFQAYPPAYYCYHQRWGKKFDAFDQGLRGQVGQFLALEKATEVLPLSQPVWWEFLPIAFDVVDQAGPRQVVLVIDKSGSMRQPGKLEMLRKNLQHFVENLAEGDQVAMISYSDVAQLEMDFASIEDSNQLLEALEQVRVGGSSLPENGLELALDLLDAEGRRGERAIILMLTDGGFQIDHPLLGKVSSISNKRIQFRLFYLGKDETYMRKRLQGLAAYGNGTYQYLRPQTAGRQLAEVLQ